MRLLMAALCSTTLLVGVEARAQGLMERALAETNAIERLLSAAETARMRGDCTARNDQLSAARKRARKAAEGLWITEEGAREYAVRIAEARARPCPPATATQPPPAEAASAPSAPVADAAPAAGPASIDRDPEFVRLSAAMEVAATKCDRAAWEAARAALIAEIERRLETEADLNHRVRLNTFKNELRRRSFPRCSYDRKRHERAIMLQFLYGPFFVASVGTGVFRDGPVGTEERYAATTDDRVDAFGITAELDLGKARFGGGFLTARSDSEYTTPAGSGRGSGMVFGELSSANTSGYLAEFGLTGDTDAEFDALWAELMYEFWGSDDEGEEDDDWEGGGFDPGGILSISGYVKYQYEWGDYRSTLQSSGTVGSMSYSFGQERDQRVRQATVSAGLELRTRIEFSPSTALTLGARAGGAYLDYSLDSDEHNTASYGPSTTRDFRIGIKDQGDGFGFEGKVQAQLEFKLSASASLTASVGADYWSKAASIRNPVDGDEVFYENRRTELITADRSYVFGALGARFRF